MHNHVCSSSDIGMHRTLEQPGDPNQQMLKFESHRSRLGHMIDIMCYFCSSTPRDSAGTGQQAAGTGQQLQVQVSSCR